MLTRMSVDTSLIGVELERVSLCGMRQSVTPGELNGYLNQRSTLYKAQPTYLPWEIR
ncbi:MAG TPA: hypothetical protein VG097_20100 [Gemmata sp.]|nr:hypothetical protein [Gemmata sp.]